MHSVNN